MASPVLAREVRAREPISGSRVEWHPAIGPVAVLIILAMAAIGTISLASGLSVSEVLVLIWMIVQPTT